MEVMSLLLPLLLDPDLPEKKGGLMATLSPPAASLQEEMVILLMSSTASEPNQLSCKWSFPWLTFGSSGFIGG